MWLRKRGDKCVATKNKNTFLKYGQKRAFVGKVYKNKEVFKIMSERQMQNALIGVFS